MQETRETMCDIIDINETERNEPAAETGRGCRVSVGIGRCRFG